jgi:hypothetical protein
MTITIQDALWKDYAVVRWSPRRARQMRALLDGKVRRIYEQLAGEAKAHKGALAFTEEELWMSVIGGLSRSCEYSGTLFGVESFGVVRRNPLTKVQGFNVTKTGFRLGAYAVCCEACADGHREFTDEQWLGLLAELRKCADSVARSAVAALGRRYSRPPRRLRVTREPPDFSSKRAKT